jgi:hypothetical protein
MDIWLWIALVMGAPGYLVGMLLLIKAVEEKSVSKSVTDTGGSSGVAVLEAGPSSNSAFEHTD